MDDYAWVKKLVAERIDADHELCKDVALLAGELQPEYLELENMWFGSWEILCSGDLILPLREVLSEARWNKLCAEPPTTLGVYRSVWDLTRDPYVNPPQDGFFDGPDDPMLEVPDGPLSSEQARALGDLFDALGDGSERFRLYKVRGWAQ